MASQVTKSMPKIVSLQMPLSSPGETSSNNTKVSNLDISEPTILRQRETLEQLSTNALAPYSPDLSIFENGDGESIKTYTCTSCGDTFVWQSSLEFHLNRKSVLINFNCDSCKTLQVFYNRCKFLQHVSTHFNQKRTTDITKAVLSPIPHILMEGIQTDFMKTFESEDGNNEQVGQESLLPSKLLEFSMNEDGCEEQIRNDNGSTVKKMELPKMSTAQNSSLAERERIGAKQGNDKNFECSECRIYLKDAYERNAHFMGNERNTHFMGTDFFSPPCNKCNMICPSECSKKAHMRLHMQVSPYVCPECGGNPSRYWENFQRHLRYQCLHYSRTVGYKCQICGTYCRSLFLFQKHCFAKHMMALIKCTHCPMAFKTAKAFIVHKVKIHHEANNNQILETIYSCSYNKCGVILMNQQKAFDHMTDHIKDIHYGYLFKCPVCELPYETKEILNKHIQRHHLRVYMEFILGRKTTQNVTEEKEANVQFNNSKIECLLCHCAFSSQQNYSLHITRSHSYGKQPCEVCKAPLRLRAEKIMHTKHHLREKIPICLLCHMKPSPPETLAAHLLSHISQIKYSTRCVICGKGLHDTKETFQHLKSEHYLKTLPQSENIISTDLQKINGQQHKESVDNDDDEDDNVPDGAMNNFSLPIAVPTTSKLSLKNKHQASDDRPPLIKKVKLQSGRCYKCDYVSTDRTAFKAHILTHKLSPNTFQCMECGQCYISEPALKLHLKINHIISNIDNYISSEGTHHTPEKEVIPETPKKNDLECSVCLEVFASEALLNTHLRSHGMAFIRAKRVSTT